MTIWREKILRSFVLISVFLTGLAVSGLFFGFRNYKTQCRSGYEFINPEPVCEISEKDDISNIADISAKIKNFKYEKIRGKKAELISVFFRDLVTRRWMGVNENDNYEGASLLKLPLMLTYFKINEMDESLLASSIKYTGNNESSGAVNIKSGTPLKSGETYTVENLIEKMIVDSDNDAWQILSEKIDSKFSEKVFIDLDIFTPTESGIDKNYVSAKRYGSMFRALYNASYLTREMSDKALKILSVSAFKDGLVNGVPSGVLVAHKFGERSYVNPAGEIITTFLHDCGIVYVPNRPYILCVMTKGSNFGDLENIIKEISGIVYKEVTD